MSRSRFDDNAPPKVAHFRIVWIRWFCCKGFDRYSSIWACIHLSRSPIIAWAVRAMIGVRCVPRLRSYSRILLVASNPPCVKGQQLPALDLKPCNPSKMKAYHNRHLHVHENDVELPALDHFHGFLAIGNNGDDVMIFL